MVRRTANEATRYVAPTPPDPAPARGGLQRGRPPAGFAGSTRYGGASADETLRALRRQAPHYTSVSYPTNPRRVALPTPPRPDPFPEGFAELAGDHQMPPPPPQVRGTSSDAMLHASGRDLDRHDREPPSVQLANSPLSRAVHEIRAYNALTREIAQREAWLTRQAAVVRALAQPLPDPLPTDRAPVVAPNPSRAASSAASEAVDAPPARRGWRERLKALIPGREPPPAPSFLGPMDLQRRRVRPA